MKRVLLFLIALVTAVCALPAQASPTSGTVQGSAYAWGENVGWINLSPSGGGLFVTDNAMHGYAWSKQYGWINFNPVASDHGVTNTPQGVLGGSAWVAGRGWLSMSGVTIDGSGRFRGIAGQAGTAVGRVSFDCASCTVLTDWRPVGSRPVSNPLPPSPVTPPTSVIPLLLPTPTLPPEMPQPEPVEPVSETEVRPPRTPVRPATIKRAPDQSLEAINKPLTIGPSESGSVTHDLVIGSARLDIFSGTAESDITIDIVPAIIDLHGYDAAVRPLADYFFDISATLTNGDAVYTFAAPVKVTLPLTDGLALGAAVYRYEASTGDWVRQSPVSLTADRAVFYTNTAGRFAVLQAPGSPERISPLPRPLRETAPLVVAGTCLIAAAYLASLSWSSPKRLTRHH